MNPRGDCGGAGAAGGSCGTAATDSAVFVVLATRVPEVAAAL